MKRCRRCAKELPVDMFGRRAASPDGKNIYCRPCNAEKQRLLKRKASPMRCEACGEKAVVRYRKLCKPCRNMEDRLRRGNEKDGGAREEKRRRHLERNAARAFAWWAIRLSTVRRGYTLEERRAKQKALTRALTDGYVSKRLIRMGIPRELQTETIIECKRKILEILRLVCSMTGRLSTNGIGQPKIRADIAKERQRARRKAWLRTPKGKELVKRKTQRTGQRRKRQRKARREKCS